MSDYPAIPFPDELVHLEQVSARLSKALQRAEASVSRADREYTDTKKYMADHRGADRQDRRLCCGDAGSDCEIKGFPLFCQN